MELHWTTQSDYPILAFLQLVPLLGIGWVWLASKSRLLLPGAMMLALLEFVLAIQLYHLFDQSNPAFQFAEQLQLLGPLYYHAAVDGMAVLFIMLTALLTSIIVIYGPLRVLLPMDRLLMLCFATTSVMMSMFVTIDLLWFTLQSVMHTALVGYLLWFWSTSPERDLAIRRYIQFMSTGIFLLLIGILFLGWQHAISHQDSGGLTCSPCPNSTSNNPCKTGSSSCCSMAWRYVSPCSPCMAGYPSPCNMAVSPLHRFFYSV